MRFCLFISFIFFLLSSQVVKAQNIKVKEKLTGEPITGVAIYNPSKSKSAISDIDGQASLSHFEDNEMLIFQHLAHKTIYIKKSELLKKGHIVYLTSDSQDLGQVVISASKFEQNKKDVPQKIVGIKAKDVQFTNPQTSADLLRYTGEVFIQKSQLGGGSPIIRGFSTNRLLITVDGVRMNNAIFRSGNLQNIISIDPFSVQNTEVILGAGSVIYGSDAIGGVMNFYTQKPILSYTDSLKLDLNAITRYASASNEKTGHVDVNLGLKKWGFLTSVSYTDFSDLKMGKHGPEDYLRQEYIQTINGEDIIVKNNDPLVQKFTGYNQINLLQKVRYEANNNLNVNIGLHYSSTSEYPRYDRLIQYRNDTLRSAEWKYGPQKWFLGNFQINQKTEKGLFDRAQYTIAYQNFQESRIDRDFESEFRRIREENVDAISLNADFEKHISSINEIFYGGEYIYNTIGSTGEEENINTQERNGTVSRYPDGSNWQSWAAYISYKHNPTEAFTFQAGLRYNEIIINADLTDNNQFLNLPFNNADLNTGALTGTAGLNWNQNKMIGWRLNFSTALRAPNIDDVGKVFDSEPGSVVVPNPNLKPERAYGGELGLLLNFSDAVNIDFSTYYTYLDDALVRRDFTLNGETEIEYDGELSTIQAIQNASKARIYGFEAGIKVSFTDELKVTSQYNLIGGSEQEVGGDKFPVRHVVPNFGNTHLIFEKDKFKLDAFVEYNNEFSFDDLSLTERQKPYLYASDDNGNPYSPAWYTLNLRSQFNLYEAFTLTASIENITDQRYRTYSSGIAAPGRNLIVSLKYSL